MRHAILIAAAAALVGCTSNQIERVAEWTGERFEDGVLVVGHAANKVGDIVGLDQPEDPDEEAEDRRWSQCQTHPCLYSRQCVELFPDTFMRPDACGTPVRAPEPAANVIRDELRDGLARLGGMFRETYDATHRARGATATPARLNGAEMFSQALQTCLGMPQKDATHCAAHARESLEALGYDLEDDE